LVKFDARVKETLAEEHSRFFDYPGPRDPKVVN
jgi:hypothetical protein